MLGRRNILDLNDQSVLHFRVQRLKSSLKDAILIFLHAKCWWADSIQGFLSTVNILRINLQMKHFKAKKEHQQQHQIVTKDI
jgi:hypothetical protein